MKIYIHARTIQRLQTKSKSLLSQPAHPSSQLLRYVLHWNNNILYRVRSCGFHISNSLTWITAIENKALTMERQDQDNTAPIALPAHISSF